MVSLRYIGIEEVVKGEVMQSQITLKDIANRIIENSFELSNVLYYIYTQEVDDICWMDVDKIYAALGLDIPDRKVGDKLKMLANCSSFVNKMCKSSEHISYADLMKRYEAQKIIIKVLGDRCTAQAELLSKRAEKHE